MRAATTAVPATARGRARPGRLRRGERMVVMAHRLFSHPYHLYSLSTFMELLGAAKSTISEDLGFLRQTFERFQLGKVETLAGAAGGVRYLPQVSREQIRSMVEDLCRRLRDPARVLPGGFLHTTDLISMPHFASGIGQTFATLLGEPRPDVVLTMEVKGIPVALETARAFNVPMVTIRREGRVTEGPSVSVNYVSGSSRMVQTMTLPLRAIPPGSKVVFVDDFLRGGGTARGVLDLVREFRAELVGIGVLIETAVPREKMAERYLSLIVYEGQSEHGEVLVYPSRHV
ncbi:MAG TPA: pur operon repressor [bacterium]|jgi:purine operon repressor|nr:pur operon repressor [bacterium]